MARMARALLRCFRRPMATPLRFCIGLVAVTVNAIPIQHGHGTMQERTAVPLNGTSNKLGVDHYHRSLCATYNVNCCAKCMLADGVPAPYCMGDCVNVGTGTLEENCAASDFEVCSHAIRTHTMTQTRGLHLLANAHSVCPSRCCSRSPILRRAKRVRFQGRFRLHMTPPPGKRCWYAGSIAESRRGLGSAAEIGATPFPMASTSACAMATSEDPVAISSALHLAPDCPMWCQARCPKCLSSVPGCLDGACKAVDVVGTLESLSAVLGTGDALRSSTMSEPSQPDEVHGRGRGPTRNRIIRGIHVSRFS